MINDAATKSRKITAKSTMKYSRKSYKINKKCSIILITFGASLIFESLKHFFTDFTFTMLVFVYKYDVAKD